MTKIDWNALNESAELIKEAEEHYDKQCDEYWNGLSQEDQLKAFFSVCKRLTKGELIDQGSYRYILYDVFGFGPEAYMIGMICGYMDLHNSIVVKEKDKN